MLLALFKGVSCFSAKLNVTLFRLGFLFKNLKVPGPGGGGGEGEGGRKY